MKVRTSRRQGWLIAGALLLVQTFSSPGAEPADTAVVQTGSVTAQTSVKLPYGVDDVLKLSKAQVSENIILTYVQTSGTTYNLGPNDIVYLKQQGVPDGVVSAMMDTQRRAAQAVQAQAAQAAQTAQYTQQAYQAAPNTAPATPQYAPVSTATYDQQPAASDTVYSQPGSSVYVIPYPQATYAYYGGYSYPGYYWPSIGFSFGYNGCYYGGYHGCYNGYHGYYNNYHNGFYNGVHSGFHSGVHTSGSFSHGASFSRAASFHGGGGGMHGGHR